MMQVPSSDNSPPGRRERHLPWLLLALFALIAYSVATRYLPAGPDWPADYDAARRAAAEKDRPLLVQFSSSACHYCKRMRSEVLGRSEVIEALSPFELVQVDAWAEEALSERYAIGAVPAFVVVDGSGRLIARTEGYRPAAEFTEFLRRAA
ncbi:MAG: thioredoxin family protein, partial [bacterium]|nr:thioredoxin family protein [bacterium]